MNVLYALRHMTAAAALAIAFAAHAGVLDTDENGFYTDDVLCDKLSLIERIMERGKEVSTGLRSSNKDWDLEIYQNRETGSWSLIGKNKKPKSVFDQACVLNTGSGKTPYQEELFYAKFFKKPGSNAPKTQATPKSPSSPQESSR